MREALEQFARDHAYGSPQEAINNGNWFVQIEDNPFAATISLGMAGYSGYDDGLNLRLMSALKHAMGKIKALPKFDQGNQVVLAVAFVPQES